MSDSTSDGPSLGQLAEDDDSLTLREIRDLLRDLIPEARRWRRSRWVVRILVVVTVLQLAFAGVAVQVYRTNRHQDEVQARQQAAQVAQRRAANERALRDECEAGAKLRAAFDVLVDAIGTPSSPKAAAALSVFVANLDRTAPHRDCAAEAKKRARAIAGA